MQNQLCSDTRSIDLGQIDVQFVAWPCNNNYANCPITMEYTSNVGAPFNHARTVCDHFRGTSGDAEDQPTAGCTSLFFLMCRRPPRTTPFPDTTLFRSSIQSTPIQSNSVHSNPIQFNPIQSNACQSSPKQSNPIQSNPTQCTLIQSNPIPSEQIQSNPLQCNRRSEEHTSELQSQ